MVSLVQIRFEEFEVVEVASFKSVDSVVAEMDELC